MDRADFLFIKNNGLCFINLRASHFEKQGERDLVQIVTAHQPFAGRRVWLTMTPSATLRDRII